MAPVVLDYDGDGKVIGGHTVNELPRRRPSAQPPATMRAQDSTARPAPVTSGQPPEQYQHNQQPHAQTSELSAYHRHSLPTGGRFVEPPPSMRPSEVPPRAHQEQLLAPPPPPAAEQRAQFSRDPREFVDYSDSTPANYQGYVRNPVQFHAVQARPFAPPPQMHPRQVYYEPVGYQHGPESLPYQNQQSLAPQHHAYMHPHQGYQARFEMPVYPQHHDGYSHRPSYYPPPVFQSQHVSHQHQYPHQHPPPPQHPHPSQHRDRRVSSASSSHVVRPPATASQYESPYAAAQAVPSRGKQRNKAPTKRTSSRATAGHEALPVVRKASIAGCSDVENVFFRSSHPDGSSLDGGNEDEEQSAEDIRSNRKAKAVIKQATEKAALAKCAVGGHAKRKLTRMSIKKNPAELLGRCTDCKKRHKKCKHLSKPNPDPEDNGSDTKTVAAGEDSHARLPMLAALALQSTGQPNDESTSKVSDAEILALVPNEDVKGVSPSQSLADLDPDTASEGDGETEVQYDSFLRSQSPEDEGHFFHGHAIDESLPATATANLLNKLHAQIYDTDPLAIEAFNQDANRYRTATLGEQEFYIRTYKLFRRANASNLLPEFVKCLPLRWKQTEVSWLNDQAELEMAKEAALLTGNVQVVPKEAMPKLARKRRPMNGFKASESLEGLDSARTEQEVVPNCEPSRTMFVRATPPGSPNHSPRAMSPDDVSNESSEDDLESPAKQPLGKATKSQRPPGKTANAKKPKEIKKMMRAPPLIIKIKKSTRPKKVQYGHLFASEVEHVGPRYTTRREVLRRGTNPYIHNLCGQGFPHPQEVRAHHKANKCHDDTSGQKWDEHPSCKADYPELNYTKVRDGYVILDQVSWDKLAAAVAAGEMEPDRLRGRELKEKGTEETTKIGEVEDTGASDDDAEHEVDEDFEAAGPSHPATGETTTPEVLTAASAAVPTPTTNQRKRAASNAVGRPAKKVIVKAGGDEITVPDATKAPLKALTSKKSTKKAVSNVGGSADDGGSPAQLMARAAALSLRARF